MNDIEEVIEMIHKRRIIQQTCREKLQSQQIQQYKTMIQRMQTELKDGEALLDGISRDLKIISTQQHSVHKLLEYSAPITPPVNELPISHEFHKDAISFFADGIDFINNFKALSQTITMTSQDYSLSNLEEKLTTCTSTIGTELCRIKSSVFQTKSLKDNINLLQEHCQVTDEDTLDDSIF